MDEIRNTAKLVKEALEKYPQARNSDSYLYYVICRDKLSAMGLDIDRVSLSNGLLYRDSYSLPPFETVRRTRQKLQSQYPELASDPEVECARLENQKEFLEYAREGVTV